MPTANDGRQNPPTASQEPALPTRNGYQTTAEDRPLPDMYFEPSFGREYLQPVVAAGSASFSGIGYGSVPQRNRGIQNVPSMNTIGVQYATDQTGFSVPITGTVPAGSNGIPFFYRHSQPAVVQFATDITGQEPGPPVADSMMPVGSGPGGPVFYQTSSAAYTCGPRSVEVTGGTTFRTVPDAGTAVVGGQPIVVSGVSCPLCGRQDHHAHSDAVVVNNSTNHTVTGVLPAATAASSATVCPQIVDTSGQPTFLAR